jgi:hypothetical protein
MRSPVVCTVLAVAGLLAGGGHGRAQGPPPAEAAPAWPVAAPVRPGLGEPALTSDQRSPFVDVLEGRAEELAAEANGEREGEGERDEIETDRDSFTPATTTAGRGRLIVESAYSFVDNRGVKETHSLPELILRYGLTKRLELRLGWNYEVGGAGSEVTGAGSGAEEEFVGGRAVRREYTLSYGVKARVTEPDGWVPGSAVIVQGFTPTGGSAGTATATSLIATYVAGWELPNRWKLDGAFRYGFASEEGDRFNSWAPSAVLKVPVGERWAAHAEWFGIFTTGKAENATRHFFSPGVHCLLTPDLEVGVRVGWGLNDQSARFFSNVGFGYRF